MFVGEWQTAPLERVREYAFIAEDQPNEKSDIGGLVVIEDERRVRYSNVPYGWYTHLREAEQWEHLWPAAIGEIRIADKSVRANTLDIASELRDEAAVSMKRCIAALDEKTVQPKTPYGIAVEVLCVHNNLVESDAVRLLRERTGTQAGEIHGGQTALANAIDPNVCREIADVDRETSAAVFPMLEAERDG